MKNLTTTTIFAIFILSFVLSASADDYLNLILSYNTTSNDSLNNTTIESNVLSNSDGNSYKIMLTPSMLKNINSDTYPALIDEQTIADNPRDGNGGNPITSWTTSWNPDSPYPHYAIVDFGEEIEITSIYIYDVDGSGGFTVESGFEENWNPLFTDSLTGYNVWNEHRDLAVKTKYLRFKKTEGGARVGEIVIYGVSGDLSYDVSLIDLTIGDSTISGFDPSVASYNIELPEGTTVVPVINATPNNPNATISVLPAAKLPGVSTIIVTAENGVTKQSYTVSFTLQNSGEKEYIHLNNERPEWSGTAPKDFYEADDFDVFWAVQLASLPAADAAWNGGSIDIGDTGKSGVGVVDWKQANINYKKPLLVVLPSAGAAPGTGICPTNYNFIVASAMDETFSGATVQGHIEAALAIRQMIKNILASGKCDGRVFVEGKSQGGGMSLITAALNPEVLETFVSVPAMTGYTGTGGTNGAWPGYATNNNRASYVDACNHAKRITTPVTFSLGFNDAVTWYHGQNTAAKNVQSSVVYLYHNTGGHSDMNWWSEGDKWIGEVLLRNDKPTLLDNKVVNSLAPVIYPNPVIDGTINIVLSEFISEDISIKLVDIIGKTVYSTVVQNVSGRISINGLDNIEKGIYLLTIEVF